MLCSRCGCEMISETIRTPEGQVIGRAETCINKNCSEYLKPMGKEKSDINTGKSAEDANLDN